MATSPPTPPFYQFALDWVKAHWVTLATHAAAFVAGAILF